jgi:hypothetical protein
MRRRRRRKSSGQDFGWMSVRGNSEAWKRKSRRTMKMMMMMMRRRRRRKPDLRAGFRPGSSQGAKKV